MTCPAFPLVSPAEGATTDTTTPTYVYSTDVETPEYELRVDNDADFSSPVLEVVTSETTYQTSRRWPMGLSTGRYAG